MKKNILIISAVIITLNLTAFSVISKKTVINETQTLKDLAITTSVIKEEDPIKFTGFIYDVSPRFEAIKKTDIDKATSISDFIDAETIDNIVDLNSVNIIVIKDEAQSRIREMGYEKELTAAQIKLLESLDYASGFTIRSEFTKYNKETGELENSFSGPHFTIVPEQQAVYTSGNDVLVDYLKLNSKNTVAEANVIIEKTRPVKFYFTVTKHGTVENVSVDRSTNYPLIDKNMIEVIKSTKGKWIPAENSKGEKVDQELVVSLGVKGLGC